MLVVESPMPKETPTEKFLICCEKEWYLQDAFSIEDAIEIALNAQKNPLYVVAMMYVSNVSEEMKFIGKLFGDKKNASKH